MFVMSWLNTHNYLMDNLTTITDSVNLLFGVVLSADCCS